MGIFRKPSSALHAPSPLVFACIILAVTYLTLAPCVRNGFVALDDPVMVTENRKILDLSLRSAGDHFLSFHRGLYHPLVLLSYAVEYRLFWLNPSVFHTTNLILHLLNALLVFRLFHLLAGSPVPAFMVALLFGIHPMHVESVAWVSERKDMLYALFYLLSAVCYVLYRRRGGRTLYYASLLSFACSLMSKPMAVTLPVVFLLIDFTFERYPERRGALAKIPFFLLAGVFVLLTMIGHYTIPQRAVASVFSFWNNLLAADYHFMFYLVKSVLPAGLSALYPPWFRWDYPQPALALFAPPATALLALGAAWSLKYTRKAVFGVLLFLVTVAPVLQFVPFGLGNAADRHTYIPYLGLFYLAAEAVVRFARRPRFGWIAPALFLAASGIFAFLSHGRCAVWRDTDTLFRDIGDRSPELSLVQIHDGYARLKRGDSGEAFARFERELKKTPNSFYAFVYRGQIFLERGDYGRALVDFRSALAVNPFNEMVYLRLGDYYTARKDYPRALEEYTRAMELNPERYEPYMLRARVFRLVGRPDKAEEDLSRMPVFEPVMRFD